MLCQYVFFCLEVRFLYEETYVFLRTNEFCLFISPALNIKSGNIDIYSHMGCRCWVKFWLILPRGVFGVYRPASAWVPDTCRAAGRQWYVLLHLG